MNKVELIGRLVKDPTVTNGNNMTIARFVVAVDRRRKKTDDPNAQTADFPSVTAFGKTAELIEKYFHKGSLIAIIGRIQTGSYTNKDGVKVYTTDVIADEVEFVGGKSDSQTPAAQPKVDTSFMNIPAEINEELPWN